MNWSSFLGVIGVGILFSSTICYVNEKQHGDGPVSIGTRLLFAFGILCTAIAIGMYSA